MTEDEDTREGDKGDDYRSTQEVIDKYTTGRRNLQVVDVRPYAEIRRIGRFRYSVKIIHHLIQQGPGGDPWIRFGRARAIKKGKKELKRYQKWLNRTSERDIVVL